MGLMGELAHAVVDGLGANNVLGVIPDALTAREISSDLIGDVRIVKDMHERKAMMARHADAFIAMPGGFGTFEELLEVVTWQQLGFHSKPIGVLNIEGYYDQLLAFFEHGISEGFISREYNQILVASDPEELLKKVLEWVPPKRDDVFARTPSERQMAIGEDISKPSDEAAVDAV